MPLIGNGLSPEAVFAELRGQYDHTVTDAEIFGVIKWAIGKSPKPSGYGNRYHNASASRPTLPVTKESATAAVGRFLKGFRCDEADLWHASPWRPLEDPAFDSLPLFAGLFHGEDLVNVCPEHGAGITKSRDQWMTHVRDHGAPSGSIGCMFRPNPVTETGSGKDGAICDSDVTAHRFALVESDILPLELQLSVIARLPLPVAAIIFSGGKSYHALVRVDAVDVVEYRRDVGRMLALLRPLGFDQSTGNPSRMSRLPGATRGEELQRLVYLNPDASEALSIFKENK
ncbi:MAG: hypothetical protein LV479_02635 [Methylacidiphilales bacterium]|nr:hypothetical protein [Candidatus Methylacidiphilales bacterium]